MTYHRAIAACLASAVLLAGCGRAALPLAGPSAGSMPEESAVRAAAGKALLRLVVKIPQRRTHARYISPSTKSMTIDLTGPTTLKQTIALTPSSPGCSSSGGVTICIVTLELLPGNYTGTFSTYDGTNPSTSRLLSVGQDVTFPIVNGIVNSVGIVLSGVPASLRLAALDPAHLTSPSVRSLGIYGLSAQIFTVTAYDAAGNAIVGNGAPSFTASASGALPLAVAPVSALNPNRFSIAVKPPWAAGATGTLTLQATFKSGTDGCAQAGANCTASYSVEARQLVAASNALNGSTQIFDLSNNGAKEVATLPGSDPRALAFDANGDVFVGNSGRRGVVEYAFGSFRELARYDTGAARALAILPNQQTLYVANGSRVVPVNLTTGVVGSPIRAGKEPVALAVSADGSKLYVANRDSNGISIIDTATNTVSKTVRAPILCHPSSLALGTSYLFVSCAFASSIVQVDLATERLLHVHAPSLLDPEALAIDTNGLLYSVNTLSASLNQYDTSRVPPSRNWRAHTKPLPLGASIDGTNRLFVVAGLSRELEIFNPDGTTFGEIRIKLGGHAVTIYQ